MWMSIQKNVMADFERPNVGVQKTHLFKKIAPHKFFGEGGDDPPPFHATLTYVQVIPALKNAPELELTEQFAESRNIATLIRFGSF